MRRNKKKKKKIGLRTCHHQKKKKKKKNWYEEKDCLTVLLISFVLLFIWLFQFNFLGKKQQNWMEDEIKFCDSDSRNETSKENQELPSNQSTSSPMTPQKQNISLKNETEKIMNISKLLNSTTTTIPETKTEIALIPSESFSIKSPTTSLSILPRTRTINLKTPSKSFLKTPSKIGIRSTPTTSLPSSHSSLSSQDSPEMGSCSNLVQATPSNLNSWKHKKTVFRNASFFSPLRRLPVVSAIGVKERLMKSHEESELIQKIKKSRGMMVNENENECECEKEKEVEITGKKRKRNIKKVAISEEIIQQEQSSEQNSEQNQEQEQNQERKAVKLNSAISVLYCVEGKTKRKSASKSSAVTGGITSTPPNPRVLSFLREEPNESSCFSESTLYFEVKDMPPSSSSTQSEEDKDICKTPLSSNPGTRRSARNKPPPPPVPLKIEFAFVVSHLFIFRSPFFAISISLMTNLFHLLKKLKFTF